MASRASSTTQRIRSVTFSKPSKACRISLSIRESSGTCKSTNCLEGRSSAGAPGARLQSHSGTRDRARFLHAGLLAVRLSRSCWGRRHRLRSHRSRAHQPRRWHAAPREKRVGYSGKFDASAVSAPGSCYRLIQQGKTPAATDELASYLRLEPTDVAARQTYLVLLYQQRRYADTGVAKQPRC